MNAAFRLHEELQFVCTTEVFCLNCVVWYALLKISTTHYYYERTTVSWGTSAWIKLALKLFVKWSQERCIWLNFTGGTILGGTDYFNKQILIDFKNLLPKLLESTNIAESYWWFSWRFCQKHVLLRLSALLFSYCLLSSPGLLISA